MIATPTAARLEDYVQPVTQNMVSGNGMHALSHHSQQ